MYSLMGSVGVSMQMLQLSLILMMESQLHLQTHLVLVGRCSMNCRLGELPPSIFIQSMHANILSSSFVNSNLFSNTNPFLTSFSPSYANIRSVLLSILAMLEFPIVIVYFNIMIILVCTFYIKITQNRTTILVPSERFLS